MLRMPGSKNGTQIPPRSENRIRFIEPLQFLLPALTFHRVALKYGSRLRQDEREWTACSSRRVCYRQIIRVNDTVNVQSMILCQLPFVPYLIRVVRYPKWVLRSGNPVVTHR
jgi:hypothetical protein